MFQTAFYLGTPSIRLASSLFKSLRIHLRHSTIRETKLPRPRLPRKRVAAKPSLLLPNQTQKANQRTTTVIPSMAVEDVLLETESELTIVAVEPGVERRSKRYVLNDQLYIHRLVLQHSILTRGFHLCVR